MLTCGFLALLAAFAAPWIVRLGGRATGWLLALLPGAAFVWLCSIAGDVSAGDAFRVSYPWVPAIGVELSFHIDGLALLFGMLITGIGALVLVYAGAYLDKHPQHGRFFTSLLLFMISMLGIVWSDNVATLFVFWELTSVTSYLLIGFDHQRDAARKAALQALLVTGLGGLALLAGLLLIARDAGTMSLSAIASSGAVRESPVYIAALVLVLLGAFTKSAQFPFHFWLPGAMEAPTPVSAYLHSSTMVKAGVYLLARLQPSMGGTDEWVYTLSIVGAVTMVGGAWLSMRQHTLKLLLAYSTVSALGGMVMLIGMGGALGAKAAATFILAHALYKGALFLVAGAVDHATHEKDVRNLSGLGRAMPLTAACACVAALSMAGVPFFFGFISKELLMETAWESAVVPYAFAGAAVFGGVGMVVVAVVVGVRPFFGRLTPTPHEPHEVGAGLWLGFAALAALCLVFGVAPGLVEANLIGPAANSIAGRELDVHLAVWHGLTPALGMSLVASALGLTIFALRIPFLRATRAADAVGAFGPARWYEWAIGALNAVATAQTRFLQSGYLRFYLIMTIATTVGLTAGMLFTQSGVRKPEISGLDDLKHYEVATAILVVLGALLAVRSKSSLGAVAALGVVGYCVALLYVFFGAPDLAMTQFAIETLTVVLFVFVFYHLPPFRTLTSRLARLRDAVIACVTGALMTSLVIISAGQRRFHEPISSYFSEHSVSKGYGRNVVNVILVDFRALDTLGEITVLAVAGVGVYALLRLRSKEGSAP